jgi:hypothetical protein
MILPPVEKVCSDDTLLAGIAKNLFAILDTTGNLCAFTFQKLSKSNFLSSVMEIFGSSRYMSNSDLELSVAVDSKNDWNSLGTIEANELLVFFEDDVD